MVDWRCNFIRSIDSHKSKSESSTKEVHDIELQDVSIGCTESNPYVSEHEEPLHTELQCDTRSRLASQQEDFKTYPLVHG